MSARSSLATEAAAEPDVALSPASSLSAEEEEARARILLGEDATVLDPVCLHHDKDKDHRVLSDHDHEDSHQSTPPLPSRIHPSEDNLPSYTCYSPHSWHQSHLASSSDNLPSQHRDGEHSDVSILGEVLSWRRTHSDLRRKRPRRVNSFLNAIFAPHCRLSFKSILLIFTLGTGQ